MAFAGTGPKTVSTEVRGKDAITFATLDVSGTDVSFNSAAIIETGVNIRSRGSLVVLRMSIGTATAGDPLIEAGGTLSISTEVTSGGTYTNDGTVTGGPPRHNRPRAVQAEGLGVRARSGGMGRREDAMGMEKTAESGGCVSAEGKCSGLSARVPGRESSVAGDVARPRSVARTARASHDDPLPRTDVGSTVQPRCGWRSAARWEGPPTPRPSPRILCRSSARGRFRRRPTSTIQPRSWPRQRPRVGASAMFEQRIHPLNGFRAPQPSFRTRRADLEAAVHRFTAPYANIIRAQLILLAAHGYANECIGQNLDRPWQLVSTWRQCFCGLGLDGLVDQPRSGNPSGSSPITRRDGEGNRL